MAVMEISVTPLGTGTVGVSEFVAAALGVAREAGLDYQLTPMGTVLEGDVDRLLAVARQMHEASFLAGARRVSTLIKLDDRRDGKDHSMAGKVAAVEDRL